MRRACFLVTAFAVSGAAMAACSSFSSDAPGESSPDAASSDAPSSSTDATDADASAADANDAAPTLPRLGSSGCANATGFLVCASYPDPDAGVVSGGFDGVTSPDPGTLGVDLASPNNYALHVQTGTIALDAGDKQIYAFKDLASPPSTLTFGAKIRAGLNSVSNYVEYLAIVPLDGDSFDVVVADSAGALSVSDSTPKAVAKDWDFGALPQTDIRVDVQLWFEASGISIEIRKNDVVTLPRQKLKAAGSVVPTGRIRFAAGLYFAQAPEQPSGAYLDDITFAALP